MVNDILDFSKIEAGQVELDPQPFDPTPFVAETVELVSAAGRGTRGSSSAPRIDGALPAAVCADGARLRQVLLNLLTNAIKFTEPAASTVTASYDADDGGRLRIAVTDTGVGIAAGPAATGCSSASPRSTGRSPANTAAPAWAWPSARAWPS